MENRANEAERLIISSQSKDEALKQAIVATELYMKAVGLAGTPAEKSQLREKCMDAMDRAEEIKNLRRWPPFVSPNNGDNKFRKLVLQAPISTRELGAKEKLVLLRSSRLHGSVFPPWTHEPSRDEFNAAKEPYINYTEVPMSEEHMEDFTGWQRPAELLRTRHEGNAIGQGLSEPSMLASGAIDLVQDVTADCSVVASLCAALARPHTTYVDLLRGMLYPFDNFLHIPKLSNNGKYIFRFNFNGCHRKVVIDDRLPGSKTARTLHVVDRKQPGLLWPALIEKAYLTVRGGYDFPGSNSGTDLWVLTSWIPEQIFLQSDELEQQPIWERLQKSFAFGDVIVTLGTGRLSPDEEDVLGLAGEHDYAMLGMREIDGIQQFLVKNPWCDGAPWKPTAHHTSVNNDIAHSRYSKEVQQNTENIHHPGTFWINFEDVVRSFNSLYLNWNPGLFQYREDHHFDWRIPEVNSVGCFTHNPQYAVKCHEGGMVWVLITRHFATNDHKDVARADMPHTSIAKSAGFISLYTFDAQGQRVHLSDNALLRGPYVDSPQTLAKLDMPPNSYYTIVLAHQGLPLEEYSFTLSAFSSAAITAGPAANPYPHSAAQDGSWDLKTAGGNAEAVTYPSNPQYRLVVPSTTPLNIVLEASPRDLAVHVKLLWAAGERVITATTRSIATDSGDYRRGCAVAYISTVPAGVYTIVCSTFDAGQTGSFKVSVEAMVSCELRLLADEDAGRLVHRMPTALLQNGINRVLAPISISRVTRLKVAAHHVSVKHGYRVCSAFRVSLEQGQGPNKKVLCVSNDGRFSDAPAGVRTCDIDVGLDVIACGGLWLVVERYGAMNAVDEIQAQILSDSRLEVGAWGTGDG